MTDQPIVPSARLTFLSHAEKERLHLATLEVLRRTGVRVHSEEALSLLERAGCAVDDGNLVRIPSHVVEEAIRTAPPSITVYNRAGEPAMSLEGTNVYFGTGSDLPNVIDLETGERRPAVKSDVANAALISDALPNVDFVMSMALAGDVPVAVSDLHSYEAMVAHTTKPIVFTAHDRVGLEAILEMAAEVAGGEGALRRTPTLILYAEPTTPLQHSREAVEKLLAMAGEGLPVAYVPGAVSGASTPVTLAGAMVVSNAELLSGLVIAQLKRRGAPCIFGAGTGPLDMHTMVGTYAVPEYMMMTTMMAEMGRYYRLPTWGFAGCSDAKLFDQQAGAEGTLWVAMAAFSGTNLVHDVGYLESGLTASMEMLVTMNEVIAMARYMLRDIDLSPEALALDVIDRVGPGGDYLAQEHTVRHCREGWFSTLFDKGYYSDWMAAGATSAGERARAVSRQILATHQPPALPDDILDRLGGIIARVAREKDVGTISANRS